MRSEQNRRSFIKTSALAAAGIALAGERAGVANHSLQRQCTRIVVLVGGVA